MRFQTLCAPVCTVSTCVRVWQCVCVCVRVFECVPRGFSRPRGLIFLPRRPPAPQPSHSVGDTHPRGDQARLAGCDMAVMGPWGPRSAAILRFLIVLSLNLGFVSDDGRDKGRACHFSAVLRSPGGFKMLGGRGRGVPQDGGKDEAASGPIAGSTQPAHGPRATLSLWTRACVTRRREAKVVGTRQPEPVASFLLLSLPC